MVWGRPPALAWWEWDCAGISESGRHGEVKRSRCGPGDKMTFINARLKSRTVGNPRWEEGLAEEKIEGFDVVRRAANQAGECRSDRTTLFGSVSKSAVVLKASKPAGQHSATVYRGREEGPSKWVLSWLHWGRTRGVGEATKGGYSPR